MASLLCSSGKGESETKTGVKRVRTSWQSKTCAEAAPPQAFPSLPRNVVPEYRQLPQARKMELLDLVKNSLLLAMLVSI